MIQPVIMPPAGGGAAPPTYLEKCLAVQAADLLAYWTLGDEAGPAIADATGNGFAGAYVNTPTLGETGIGDGLTCALFDEVSAEYGNVYSAGLAGVFDGAEGTIAAWLKVSAAGIWTDGLYHYGFELGADTNNRAWLYKANTNNTLAIGYRAGGTIKNVNTAFSSTDWFHAAVTWSAAADEVKAYINGVQTGVTQTGLGVWAGALANGWCLLMCDNTPRYYFPGWMAHAAVWSTPLSDAEIETLAEV